MKYLAIIFLFLIVSCKNETADGLDPSVYEMWEGFTNAHPEFKNENLPEAFPFHNNEFDAKRLANLIVNGKKKAFSSLYARGKATNAELPKIGTKSIVTNFDGKARAIIEFKKVETVPFNEVSKDYAEVDMGTTIEPLKKWKKAHWEFFENSLGRSGEKPTEEMLVVCHWFETVWPEKQ